MTLPWLLCLASLLVRQALPGKAKEGVYIVSFPAVVRKLDFLSIFPSVLAKSNGKQEPTIKVWLVLISLPLSIITKEEKKVRHAFVLKMLVERGKGGRLDPLSAQHPNQRIRFSQRKCMQTPSARAKTFHQGPFSLSRRISVLKSRYRSSVLCLEHPSLSLCPNSVKPTMSLKSCWAGSGVLKLRTGLGADMGLEPHLHHQGAWTCLTSVPPYTHL